jgi:quercetin dioxygenase-like cupin family protein
MEVRRNGTRALVAGPAQNFTGHVRIDPLFQAPSPAKATEGWVTFDAGARTAWHDHPLGQTLIVTSGCGWAQCWGETKIEIRAGDVVWFPPGVKHWHGATATTGMSHIAVQEHNGDGNLGQWFEHVSDEQYLSAL